MLEMVERYCDSFCSKAAVVLLGQPANQTQNQSFLCLLGTATCAHVYTWRQCVLHLQTLLIKYQEIAPILELDRCKHCAHSNTMPLLSAVEHARVLMVHRPPQENPLPIYALHQPVLQCQRPMADIASAAEPRALPACFPTAHSTGPTTQRQRTRMTQTVAVLDLQHHAWLGWECAMCTLGHELLEAKPQRTLSRHGHLGATKA
jgi:hypothetical protein